MGYETGYDLERAIESARWIAGELGIEPPGWWPGQAAFPIDGSRAPCDGPGFASAARRVE